MSWAMQSPDAMMWAPKPVEQFERLNPHSPDDGAICVMLRQIIYNSFNKLT